MNRRMEQILKVRDLRFERSRKAVSQQKRISNEKKTGVEAALRKAENFSANMAGMESQMLEDFVQKKQVREDLADLPRRINKLKEQERKLWEAHKAAEAELEKCKHQLQLALQASNLARSKQQRLAQFLIHQHAIEAAEARQIEDNQMDEISDLLNLKSSLK